MGHVWLVRDEETGLDVALKMVGREGKAAERAEREAKAAASLRHPRCQRIYTLARDPGHVYIAYEYVPGRTLRQVLSADGLDDRDAVEVGAQILDALAHAHGRGIVHRDVKPSNVLLAETEGLDVRLLDFGLAQMAEFDTLTTIGDVPGTLGYVSPERLLGKQATAAADVWGVGVMLWEALAGVHPFRDAGMRETSRRIQTGAPPLAEQRPDLPEALRKAVASALALNPARRPSAAALAEELRIAVRPRKSRKPHVRRPQRPAYVQTLRDRVVPAAACGVGSAWVASVLPFYPEGWPLGLAAAGAALGFAAPRVGLLFALTVALFPLANISLGLALVYAAVAGLCAALAWNDARAGLVALAGPLLAPFGLVPLAAQLASGAVRRGAQAGAAAAGAPPPAGPPRARPPPRPGAGPRR